MPIPELSSNLGFPPGRYCWSQAQFYVDVRELIFCSASLLTAGLRRNRNALRRTSPAPLGGVAVELFLRFTGITPCVGDSFASRRNKTKSPQHSSPFRSTAGFAVKYRSTLIGEVQPPRSSLLRG